VARLPAGDRQHPRQDLGQQHDQRDLHAAEGLTVDTTQTSLSSESPLDRRFGCGPMTAVARASDAMTCARGALKRQLIGRLLVAAVEWLRSRSHAVRCH
jgi:hypothetical protein